MWKEVHRYIRTMRTGFSDNSEIVYRTMRKIMYLYYLYRNNKAPIEPVDDNFDDDAETVKQRE